MDLHHALDLFLNALIFADHLWWHGADDVVGFIVVGAQQAAVQIVDDATDRRIARIRHRRRRRGSAVASMLTSLVLHVVGRDGIHQRAGVDAVIRAHAGDYGRMTWFAADVRHGDCYFK